MNGDIEIGAEVFAEIGNHISNAIDKAVDEFLIAQKAKFDFHASPLSVTASAIGVTGQATVVDLGGPNIGRVWEITAITLVGADDRTVIAGTNVAFYIGVASLKNIQDLILPGSQGGTAVSVPANAQFSGRQIIAQYPEHAYFIVYGLAAGAQVTGGGSGWDRDVLEYPVGW